MVITSTTGAKGKHSKGALMNNDRQLWPYILIGLSMFFIIGASTELVTHLIVSNQQERQRSSTLEHLATLRARLEGEINSTLHLTRGLIAYVATHPEVDETEFSQLSSEITSVGRNIRNIGLARNNVITHVFPLAGNEAALGIEYEKIPSQWSAVRRAMDIKGTVVAGPVNLVQGGTAFIARTPIYTRMGISGVLSKHKPSYWGVASIVIDSPSLFGAAGIHEQVGDIRLAVRGKDGLGAEGGVIFGSASIFDMSPVLQSVKLPNGSWQIAAIPSGGWGVAPLALWGPRLTGWAVALIFSIVLVSLVWTHATNKRLALHDHLTKLPNRRLLEDRLNQTLTRNRRDKKHFGLIYVDLDEFKNVNDSLGHKAGDLLLIEVAQRLKANLRDSDTVARIGGDEFIILVDGISRRSDLDEMQDNLERALSSPALIESHHVDIKASMGSALYPDDGGTAEELQKTGDSKMYHKKLRSKGNVRPVDFNSKSSR